MSIYYEYLSDYERSIMIERAKIDNEFEKLQTLYEMTNLQLSQLEKEAEHKVFSESGTYDDLTYLLQEAGNEVIEKKKGIIATIIDAIKRLFNAITGKSNEIKSSQVGPDEMISVPSDLEEKSTIITNAMNNIQTGVTKLQNGDFTGALNILKTAAAPVALVTIAGGVTYKQIKKRKGDEICANMDKAKNFFNGIWDKVKSKIPGLSNVADADNANACLNPIQFILKAINSVFDAIKNGVSKILNKNVPNEKEVQGRKLAKTANLLEKPDNTGGKYLIDRTTGEIKHLDKDGNELAVDMNNIPRNIIQASQQLKGRAAAQARDAKQKANETAEINAGRTQAKTFTPDQTGVKVYVDPTSARLLINGKSLTLPTNLSRHKAIKLLKQYGVTNNFDAIIQANLSAHIGLMNVKNKQMEIDERHAKTQRQLRQESVCEYMNEMLGDTVFEAVIEDDHISLLEYNIEHQSISEDIIHALESEGYTIDVSDNFYEIYE